MNSLMKKAAIALFAMTFVLTPIASRAVETPSTKAAGINVPVTYYILPNGLRVVLSPETSAPLITVAVYYISDFASSPVIGQVCPSF